MSCQHLKPPYTLINMLFILPLPSPFSNEYISGNKLTYLLPKFIKGYCAVIFQLWTYNFITIIVVSSQLTFGVNAYCSCTSCSSAHLVLNFCYCLCDTATPPRLLKDQNTTIADTGQSNIVRMPLRKCFWYVRNTFFVLKKVAENPHVI